MKRSLQDKTKKPVIDFTSITGFLFKRVVTIIVLKGF